MKALINFVIPNGITVLITLGAAILNGLALAILWGWFVVPIFNLPQLATIPATGLALMFGYFTDERIYYEANKEGAKDENPPFIEFITDVFAAMCKKPLATLILGWVLHKFM